MTEKIQLEGFRVVGVEGQVAPMGAPGYDPEAIPRLWRILMENTDVMALADGPMYGVGEMDAATGKMRYVAGFASNAEIAGYASIDVPSGAYFVMPHHGPLAEYGHSVMKFFSTTVPTEGLALADGPFLEVYTDEFDAESPTSRFDTLFPAG